MAAGGCGHPSRLGMKNAEHLTMTAVVAQTPIWRISHIFRV
jgi:hypothetical protein